MNFDMLQDGGEAGEVGRLIKPNQGQEQEGERQQHGQEVEEVGRSQPAAREKSNLSSRNEVGFQDLKQMLPSPISQLEVNIIDFIYV